MRARLSKAFPTCVLTASILATINAAHADSDMPLRLILSETLSRDSNVFRQAVAPIADTTTSTNLGLIFDKTLSRQSIHAEMSRNTNRYQRLNSLDNDGSRTQANWRGDFPGRLSANATTSRSESLSSFADTTQKNIVTTSDNGFGLSYAAHPDLLFSADIGHGSSRNSAAFNSRSDLETDRVQLGFQYVSQLGNSVGLSTIHTKGHYPNQQSIGINTDYVQKDMLFNLKWTPGIRSSLAFQAGRTQREQESFPQGNFSGTTGGLAFDWAITPKTSLNVNTGRELMAQNDGLSTYSVLRRTGFGLNWIPTAKMALSLAFNRQQRTYGADPISAIVRAPDTTSGLIASIGYTPIDKVRLSLQLLHERRDSDNPLFVYDANVATASAQVSF